MTPSTLKSAGTRSFLSSCPSSLDSSHASSRWSWLLLAGLLIPALRASSRYVFTDVSPFAALLSILVFAAVFWILLPVAERRVGPRIAALLLASMVIIVLLVYPVADGLRDTGGGSDADDAIVIGVSALLAGTNPYLESTAYGNRLSPGPGWLFLLAPLTTIGLYPLVSPLLLGLSAVVIGLATGARGGALFLVLVCSSLATWEIVVVGGDQLSIGLAVVVILAATFAALEKRALIPLHSIAVVAGLVATSRVVFFFLPAMIGVLMARRDRRLGLAFAAIGTTSCLATHAAFYSLAPAAYSPLHLFARGRDLLGIPGATAFAIVAIVWFLSAARAARGAQSDELGDWLLFGWTGLFMPLAMTAMGDLVRIGLRLEEWEGASYLLPPLPLFVGFWVLKIGRQNRYES